MMNALSQMRHSRSCLIGTRRSFKMISSHYSSFRVAVVVVSLVLLSSCLTGAEFHLEVVGLDRTEALSLPGVSGALVYPAQPDGLTSEPTPVSALPLYGTLPTGCSFRLDETHGTGSGYDELLVDVNKDGNLADDKAYTTKGLKSGKSMLTIGQHFGPISMKPDCATAGLQQASYYAGLTIYNPKRLSKGGMQTGEAAGFLVTKPATYLRAHVVLGSRTNILGFVDGNGDSCLGDTARFRSPAQARVRDWQWWRSDYLFRDGSAWGPFARRLSAGTLEPGSDVIYFAGQPYLVSLTEQRVRLDPCEATGLLKLTSDTPITSLVLLRKTTSGEWSPLVPQVTGNIVRAPVGTYQLLSCSFTATRGKEIFTGHAFTTSTRQDAVVDTTHSTVLPCGTPLSLKVTATPSSEFHPYPGVALRATLLGGGGESYGSFVRKGATTQAAAPQPAQFRVDGGWAGQVLGSMKLDRNGVLTATRGLPSTMVGQSVRVEVNVDLTEIGLPTTVTGSGTISVRKP